MTDLRSPSTAAKASRRARPRFLFPCLLVIGVLVSLAGNRPMLTADLGPVDDHETVRWQGPDGRIALSEIPGLLQTTEVGNFGETARYRPVAYTLKLLESWAFGYDPPLWYLIRTVLLGLAIGLLAFGVSGLLERALAASPVPLEEPVARWARWLVPIVGLIVIQGLPVWEGLVNRLGPSENYAMLALASVVGTVARQTPTRGQASRAGLLGGQVLLLALLFTALIFTKETLVSLAPLLALALWSARDRVAKWVLAAAVVMAALGPLILSAALGAGHRLESGDVYGRSFGLSRIYETGLVWVRSPWLAVLLLAALGVAVFLDNHRIPGLRELKWWVLASGAAQFIDMFGHAGVDWLRYRLILDLGVAFQGAVVAVGLVVLMSEANAKRRIDPVAQRWGVLIVLGAVVTASVWGGFAIRYRDGRAEQRAEMAEQFNRSVADASDLAGARGLVIVVLEVASDSEWGSAAQTFLMNRYGGVASVVVVRSSGGAQPPQSLVLGPDTRAEVQQGPLAATAAGVDVVCLSMRRTTTTPIPLCEGLPAVDHP